MTDKELTEATQEEREINTAYTVEGTTGRVEVLRLNDTMILRSSNVTSIMTAKMRMRMWKRV